MTYELKINPGTYIHFNNSTLTEPVKNHPDERIEKQYNGIELKFNSTIGVLIDAFDEVSQQEDEDSIINYNQISRFMVDMIQYSIKYMNWLYLESPN